MRFFVYSLLLDDKFEIEEPYTVSLFCAYVIYYTYRVCALVHAFLISLERTILLY